MRNLRMLSMPIVLLLAASVGAAAPPESGEILERRITLNLQEAPAKDLFGLFAQLMEAELQLDFEAAGGVNLAFDEIKVRTALNAFCESVGCHWELLKGDPPVLRFSSSGTALEETEALVMDKHMSLDLVDASASHVLKLFAELLGTQLAIDMPIEGRTITIDRDDLPVSTMLDEVCEELGCSWGLIGDGPVTLKIKAAKE